MLVFPTETVLSTSIEMYSILVSSDSRYFGGIIWVIYPTSSLVNAELLNPLAVSAFAPKF